MRLKGVRWLSGMPETPCGFGSTVAFTGLLREWLGRTIKRYGIKTLNDVGCGDQNWVREVPGILRVDYLGYDLNDWGEAPFPHVIHDVLTGGPLRHCDAVLCRAMMIHFNNDESVMALERFSDCSDLLIATSYPLSENEGRCPVGAGYAPINLSKPPFSCELLDSVNEGRGGILGLWKMTT